MRGAVRVRSHHAGMTAFGVQRLDTGGRMATEWNQIRDRPSHLARARSWGIVDGPIDDLDDVLVAVGYERPSDPATEQRLRALVVIAATDELAARVVIQRLLPGLLAVVRRRRGITEHVFEELLGAAWIAVRTFNPARSPSSIAASLISDADYGAFRAAGRRRSSGEQPVDLDFTRRPDDHEPSSCEQLAAVLAEAEEAGIDPADLELIRQWLAAPNATQLAEQLRVTTRTIRNRRRRITNELRAVALAA